MQQRTKDRLNLVYLVIGIVGSMATIGGFMFGPFGHFVSCDVFRCKTTTTTTNAPAPSPVPSGSTTTTRVVLPIVQADVVVTAAGQLVRDGGTTGAVTAFHQAVGKYDVAFDQDVRSCAYVATLGNPGSGSAPDPAFVTLASELNVPAGVFVAVYDSSGRGIDAPFHLVVTCSRSSAWAVTSGGGVIVRANSAAVTAMRTGAGRYEVAFDRVVSSCAYVATLANPSSGSAPTPAFVSVARLGSAPAAVVVEVNDWLGRGIDAPFHLVVACSGTSSWAVSSASGAIIRASGADGAVTAVRDSAGRYDVVFDRDVSSCAYVATIAGPGAGLVPMPAFVTLASELNAPAGVFVVIYDSTGRPLDVPFYLTAVC